MDTVNNTPAEQTPVPAPESTPEVAAAPAPAPAATPAPAPAPRVKMELPQTDGHTVGGWNRFAGYNPNAPKKNDKNRGGDRGRR